MSKFYTREDVLRRFYRNIRFSFRTCFGWRGRLLILPVFECACWAQALLQLLRGKGVALRAHLWAVRELWRMKARLRSVRSQVQSTRKLSDSELFRIVMCHRTWRELWEHIRVNL